MKFSLLKTEDDFRIKKLSKSKINFLKKDKDVSLFHFNKLNNGLFHAVFNVNDEYQVGTRKLGQQYKLSYSSLVNFFFLQEKGYALIEHINDEFRDEVMNYVENRTKSRTKLFKPNNDVIINIFKNVKGTVKKIEFSNEDDELFDEDYVSSEEFNEIAGSYIIDRVTLLVDDQFLSITNKGSITVDNSDEKFLIGFTKRILNSIV